VTQGLGLDVKPYGLLTSESFGALNGGSSQQKANAGLDLFYNPTQGVRANLTINTDFAQTEVDQRQVNLTRFSLFFPERRDFFLDGATFFDFASDSAGGPQIQPFSAGASGSVLTPHRKKSTSERSSPGRWASGRWLPAGSHGSRRWSVHSGGLPGGARETTRAAAVVLRRDLHPTRCPHGRSD